jgi:hypothetical protein
MKAWYGVQDLGGRQLQEDVAYADGNRHMLFDATSNRQGYRHTFKPGDTTSPGLILVYQAREDLLRKLNDTRFDDPKEIETILHDVSLQYIAEREGAATVVVTVVHNNMLIVGAMGDSQCAIWTENTKKLTMLTKLPPKVPGEPDMLMWGVGINVECSSCFIPLDPNLELTSYLISWTDGCLASESQRVKALEKGHREHNMQEAGRAILRHNRNPRRGDNATVVIGEIGIVNDTCREYEPPRLVMEKLEWKSKSPNESPPPSDKLTLPFIPGNAVEKAGRPGIRKMLDYKCLKIPSGTGLVSFCALMLFLVMFPLLWSTDVNRLSIPAGLMKKLHFSGKSDGTMVTITSCHIMPTGFETEKDDTFALFGDFVYVLRSGKILKYSGNSLIAELEMKGISAVMTGKDGIIALQGNSGDRARLLLIDSCDRVSEILKTDENAAAGSYILANDMLGEPVLVDRKNRRIYTKKEGRVRKIAYKGDKHE